MATNRVIAAALLAALVLAAGPSRAQRRRKKNAPVHFPQDNIPERRPTPGLGPDEETKKEDRKQGQEKAARDDGPGAWETIVGTAGECVGVVKGWHGKLTEHLPAPAAWVVLAAPVWLLLLLFLLRARRRRAPRRARTKKRAKPKVEEAPQPRTRRESRIADATPKPRGTRSDPAKIPTLEHSPAERLMLMTDEGQVSLHEAFVAMGADAHSVLALRQVTRDAIDEPTWLAAVKNQKVSLLRPLRARWTKSLAARRVQGWLEADPLVSDAKLAVGMPELHEVSELGSVLLSRPDGLGADLNEAQEGLLQQARWILQQSWQKPSPYVLMVVARRSKVRALLGNPDIDHYALALALHGVEAVDHGASAQGNPAGLGEEFTNALAEHRQVVDTAVGGEGCAVHALNAIGGGRREGIGTICASMAGAAFSPMAVTLRISKIVGGLSSAQQQACERLGTLVQEALATPKAGDGAAMMTNIRRVLGQEVVNAAARQIDETASRLKRLTREPVWIGGSTSETPDQVLVGLHRTLLQHTKRQTEAAEQRLFGIIEKLAYAGKQGENLALGMQRLGYAVACFNMALLRSASTELLSSGREAVGELGIHGG
jgi:hypothetical protein